MSRWYDPWGISSETYHLVTHAPTAAEKRVQMNAIQDQVKFYKDQTAIAESETARKRDEMSAEKRRINEKQIRALRRSSRPSGFMEAGRGDELNTQLGG